MNKKQPHMLAKHVKTAKKRSSSSTQWLNRQLNDPYVAMAKQAGYRARSAFKLIELNDKFHFVKPILFALVFGHGGEMPATVPALRHMIAALEENFPNGDYLWGYTQAHREDWEMVKTALDMGASTVRIGFEDSDMIAPGVHVNNNAALIAKVSDIVKSNGMMPMTPDEARAMLHIPPLRR